MIFRTACGACLAIGMVLTGCGGGTSVHGKISVNGKPVEEAEIQFVSIDSKEGDQAGTVVSKGEYTLQNAVSLKPGDYQVQIRAYRGTGTKTWDGMGDGTNKHMVEEIVQFIPNKYNDASELKVTLKRGDNTYDANLDIPHK